MINDQRAVKWFDIDQQGQLILKQDCSVTGRDTQFWVSLFRLDFYNIKNNDISTK